MTMIIIESKINYIIEFKFDLGKSFFKMI